MDDGRIIHEQLDFTFYLEFICVGTDPLLPNYNGALTESISRFTDTTDFIKKLRRIPRLPPGCLLVTLDVSSLCTNIAHEGGIIACEELLNCREVLVPPAADLCQPIRLVLTKNSFVFNQANYLQIHSTAMGTRMAQSSANLFMGKLELEFLQTQDKVHVPRVWWR